MEAKALIRKPLAAAVLGAAFVAVPAGALFLYSSEHSAEAAAAVPGSAAQVAPAATPLASGLPDFRPLVQRYHFIRPDLHFQLAAQQLGKKMLIAVPLP